ncbi:hypothetical protein EK904_007965 [Melospiza melodia maxima]|nr:hypothetical protein EK904_007965 [Melospiza melodia maxima]
MLLTGQKVKQQSLPQLQFTQRQDLAQGHISVLLPSCLKSTLAVTLHHWRKSSVAALEPQGIFNLLIFHNKSFQQMSWFFDVYCLVMVLLILKLWESLTLLDYKF